MSSQAKSIMEGMASLFGSGSRQGGSAKQLTKKQYDSGISQSNAESMVRNADPVKRAKAAASIKKAFN